MESGNVLSPAQGDFTIVHGGGKASPGKAVSSLLLLFSRGKCPDAASLRDALGQIPAISISLDHGDLESGAAGTWDAKRLTVRPMRPVRSVQPGTPSVKRNGPWFELVSDALTFELRGFSTGTIDAQLAQNHVADLALVSETQALSFERALIMRVSPHLADGGMATPVLRGLCKAASELGMQLSGLIGFAWPEAGAFVAADRFHLLVDHWTATGTLPVELFIQFRDELDQGLASRGLAAFIGQELRLEPELIEDRSAAERLGQRIAAQLIPMGKLTQTQDFAMPDGRNLRLEPSKNRRFVRAFLG